MGHQPVQGLTRSFRSSTRYWKRISRGSSEQRHTSKRIYERLRDVDGFTGGITIVTDYVREKKRRTRGSVRAAEHAPGHAQVIRRAGGVVSHYFAMSLDHSAQV